MIRFVICSLFGVLLLAACSGANDTPIWGEERAKAEIANFKYEDELMIWKEEVVAYGRPRIAPVKLTTSNWKATYEGLGVWMVEGGNIGKWTAFEDGTDPTQFSPVPSLTPFPILQIGEKIRVHINPQWSDFPIEIIHCNEDWIISGFEAPFGAGAIVEVLEFDYCIPRHYRIRAPNGSNYWVDEALLHPK